MKRNRVGRRRVSQNRLVYKRTELDKSDTKERGGVFSYVILFILASFFIYLAFFSGFFVVSEVSVLGTYESDPESIKKDIEERLNGQIVENNIFLLNSRSLKRELRKKYGLDTAKVKKKYPNGIEIEVKEFMPEIQWYSKNKYYLVDKKGKVVTERDKEEDNIPKVIDKKNLPIEIGESLVTEEFINFIKYVYENFDSTGSGSITKIEIKEGFNEIKVFSNNGYYILFDTTRNPETEIKNLGVAVKSEGLKGKKLNYIDMRIENKVFYK